MEKRHEMETISRVIVYQYCLWIPLHVRRSETDTAVFISHHCQGETVRTVINFRNNSTHVLTCEGLCEHHVRLFLRHCGPPLQGTLG